MIDISEESEYVRPNKSQLKREAQALLDLAKSLEDLPEQRWPYLDLPAHIIDALRDLRVMQKGARKRQFKLIAKYLRDASVDKALDEVENLKQAKAEINIGFHRIERWRERLLNGGEPALTAFLAEYQGVDIQRLGQLIRSSKQESLKNKPLKSSKLLYKFLKDLLE
ncbi:MAG: ribosome biogenesis factor YjgA [Ghiorsea sp.]|nr:ribosome biogenesis factor YjgA [Ghiorsea sp.]